MIVISPLTSLDAQKACDLVCDTADRIMKQYEQQESVDALKAERTPSKLMEKAMNREYIVAKEKDDIVGVGGVKENEIRTMFVRHNLIKQGVGTKLMKSLENIVKEKGYKDVFVKANIGAQDFYSKMGYKLIRQYDEPVGDTTYQVILMSKELS